MSYENWKNKAQGFQTMDVRHIQGSFFEGLKKRAETLEVGEGLHIIQTFEPHPLYAVMEGLGYEHHTEQRGEAEFHVWFCRVEKQEGDSSAEREKRADMVTKPTRDTLFTCIDNYIKAKEIAGREKATLAEYHKFEKHLHEYSLFEKKPVQTITERDVIDYLLYLDTIKKLAANTRRKHYDFLKSVLNKAVRDRIIPANPIAYLDAPRKTPSCAKAMPEELFKRVL